MHLKTSSAAIAAIMIGWFSLGAEPAVADECAPTGDLQFLCGIQVPEDLISLPGERWIVASGMAPGSGLHLIDADKKEWKRWIAPAASSATAPFDMCPSQAPSDELQLHGLHARDNGNGHVTLYAVNHGGSEPLEKMNIGREREAIEVFDIDMTGEEPMLSWQGCVPMPDRLVANSVASGPDGAVYATVMLHPDNTMEDLWAGKPTGAIYKWTPETAIFKIMPGTERTGNNGIEVSSDGSALYVTSQEGVTKLSNTSPATQLDTIKIPGGVPDNIHWVGEKLVVAGPRTDLCPPTAEGAPCLSGYHVSYLDPNSLSLKPLAKGAESPKYGGTSVGLPVGQTLWLGSYSSDRVAYRELP
ncbi:hypothetical protein [Neorhizobium sp. S3-V5DH]|uniref:hypothetical protein n=1 Tax=Neorhizobium sp. S3-V5DH TaxID=2485166 RepID=UPI00104D2824|nr:hypothetical protein [Neorhizobium sp. S3-V5DH]TCV67440.1 hypothetical protein EDE09_11399 [Neorhizobium sp. S3-V5DH]